MGESNRHLRVGRVKDFDENTVEEWHIDHQPLCMTHKVIEEVDTESISVSETEPEKIGIVDHS